MAVGRKTLSVLSSCPLVHMRTDHMATIQAVHGSGARLEDYRAGYLRIWRWVTENPGDNCRGFSLISDGNGYRLYGISFKHSGKTRNLSILL